VLEKVLELDVPLAQLAGEVVPLLDADPVGRSRAGRVQSEIEHTPSGLTSGATFLIARHTSPV